jgi:hypothetical protein
VGVSGKRVYPFAVGPRAVGDGGSDRHQQPADLTMPTPPRPCLSCRERLPRSRGLCNRCHLRLGRAVRSGETTWARLEAAGLVLPAAPAGTAWRRGFKVGDGAGR